jgi:DNA-binding response OmpR family regulator
MPTPKGKSILIVADDEDLTNLYETFLKYDGYRVDAFTDPIDALYYFRKNAYDLVLLDLKMPQMNGLVISRIASRFESHSRRLTPVVIQKIKHYSIRNRSFC